MSEEKVKNLMDGLLSQMDRCRELLTEYEAIGSSGQFGAMFIRQSLDEAKKSISENDVIKMLQAYEKLKGHK